MEGTVRPSQLRAGALQRKKLQKKKKTITPSKKTFKNQTSLKIKTQKH